MSRLVIKPSDLEAIGRHGEATFPEECCGFLIGRAAGDTTTVERLLPVDNERQDSRHNRFVINPETVLAAHKEARAAGADVVGYYHSHPDHPSRPSQTDTDRAWPDYSYVIISVQKGTAANAQSWVLNENEKKFYEEPLAIEGDSK